MSAWPPGFVCGWFGCTGESRIVIPFDASATNAAAPTGATVGDGGRGSP